MAKSRQARRLGRGSISRYKTKSGTLWRWQAWVDAPVSGSAGGRIRIGGSGFETAAEADTAMGEGIAEHARTKDLPALVGRPLLVDFAGAWLGTLKLAPATVKGYERLLRCHVYPYLGKRPIDDITSRELNLTYRMISEHGRRDVIAPGGRLSPNTVNKVHVLIGALFEAAIDEGFMSQNPARRHRIVNAPTGAQIRASQAEVKTWDEAQLRYFLAWNRDVYEDELYVLWFTIAFTGMRRGEATALKWSDLDLANLIISIRRAADPVLIRQTKSTKTGRQRPVTIHAELAELLADFKERRRALDPSFAEADAFVFGLRNGELRSPNDISARWARAMKKAVSFSQQDVTQTEVLPFVTLKGLRHTHATQLMRAGINPKIVQERLGHSTISTTMNIYSHVSPTMQREAVATLLERSK